MRRVAMGGAVMLWLIAGCASQRELGDYAGEYRLQGGAGVSLIVRPDSGRLMGKVEGQDYFEMFAADRDSFQFKVADAKVKFAREADELVSGLTLRQGGQEFHFKRIAPDVPEDFCRRVDAGAYRARVMKMGTGRTSVVFESGLGESLDAWAPVAREVSGFATVIAYDRAGLGLSETAKAPRTARNIAIELKRILRRVGARGPVIIVGNSAGGLYARVFAHEFPDAVAGLVLVEASSEDYEDWLGERHPEMLRTMPEELQRAAPGFADHVAGWKDSLEQARRAWPLPEVPVVVLTGGRADAGEEERRRAWIDAHEKLAARIPGAKHLVSEKSAHGLAANEPSAVTEAIREMVKEIEGRSTVGSRN